MGHLENFLVKWKGQEIFSEIFADIESKHERKGVKSEATKQKGKAYKNMLANLRGMNDQK